VEKPRKRLLIAGARSHQDKNVSRGRLGAREEKKARKLNKTKRSQERRIEASQGSPPSQLGVGAGCSESAKAPGDMIARQHKGRRSVWSSIIKTPDSKPRNRVSWSRRGQGKRQYNESTKVRDKLIMGRRKGGTKG